MSDEMILRPSDIGNFAGIKTGRQHLSHTKLSRFLNCPRKFEHEYVSRLELIERPAALELGKAFQLSIEHNNPAFGAIALREGYTDEDDDVVFEARRINTQDDEDRLRRDETMVEAAAGLYLSRWPAPTTEHREYEYLVRLRSPYTGHYSQTFDLKGYADGIVYRPDKEHATHLELIENKFVGQVDSRTIRRLPLDRQVTLACYALWRATGLEVRACHYRLIKKPSIKQKQNESIDQFCERLAADYADPERRDFYSHEESLFRSAADLLRVEAELWEWADMMRAQAKRRLYPRNTSMCHEYGGCAFISLCSNEPGAEGLYRRKPERNAGVSDAR